MTKNELSLLDREILNIKNEIAESDRKLEYLTGSEATRENYHNGTLHLQLRKYTVLANNNYHTYYCSRCGEKCDSWKERILHVQEDHDDTQRL